MSIPPGHGINTNVTMVQGDTAPEGSMQDMHQMQSRLRRLAEKSEEYSSQSGENTGTSAGSAEGTDDHPAPDFSLGILEVVLNEIPRRLFVVTGKGTHSGKTFLFEPSKSHADPEDEESPCEVNLCVWTLTGDDVSSFVLDGKSAFFAVQFALDALGEEGQENDFRTLSSFEIAQYLNSAYDLDGETLRLVPAAGARASIEAQVWGFDYRDDPRLPSTLSIRFGPSDQDVTTATIN